MYGVLYGTLLMNEPTVVVAHPSKGEEAIPEYSATAKYVNEEPPVVVRLMVVGPPTADEIQKVVTV